MRPNSHDYIEMQLPPLEQTVVTDLDQRTTHVETGQEIADVAQHLVGADG